jgi:hypothetical protein
VTYPRGTFHQAYALPKNSEPHREKTHRLLDCLISVAPMGAPDYLDAPEAGEFAVVDTWTKEKAWFEMPNGCTPELVGQMIASTFNAGSFRISNKVWCV